jgi:LPXTG-motif cell wall-anchored protein
LKLRYRRNLARFGTATLLAGAAVGLAGGPAFADDTADLAVTLSGTTLAATTSGKVIDVTLTNNGPSTATGVVVVFDLGELDTSKVTFEVPDAEACEANGDQVACGVVDVKSGQALDLGASVTSEGGSGDAGSITVTVTHTGTDPEATNNSATADVTIAGSGPDLHAYAPDVPFDPETGETGTVAPGGTAKLLYSVGNFGDEAVTGVKLTITLPQHVTFVEVEPGCGYNAANTVATCTYEDMPIVPADDDTSTEDEVFSAMAFYNLVKVADDAPAPGNLTGGSVSVEPIVADGGPTVARRTAAALPENVAGASAEDVDATDNTDEFVVYVAAPGGAGGGDGDGGTLPITGTQVGLISGIGLAVVAAGGILLLMARRRRVVLVTPQDEIPTT